MKLADILSQYHDEVERFVQSQGEKGIEYGTPLFLALYEHYSANGEMPYGIQKARTGDPEIWICARIGTFLGL